MSEWKNIETAPKDRPILVKYDHNADPYIDPNDRNKLTDYASIAEGGDFLTGSGFAVVVWANGYHDDNGYEDPYGPYWVPGGWFLCINGEPSDYICNPVGWYEIKE